MPESQTFFPFTNNKIPLKEADEPEKKNNYLEFTRINPKHPLYKDQGSPNIKKFDELNKRVDFVNKNNNIEMMLSNQRVQLASLPQRKADESLFKPASLELKNKQD